MVETWLPYGKTEIAVRIPDENLMKIIGTSERQVVTTPIDEIRKALENPLGGLKIEDLAKPGKKVAIVLDDKTRYTPSQLILPSIIEKLEKAGIRNEDITLIFGCGTHSMNLEEASTLISPDIAKKVKLTIHDSNDHNLINIGTTSFGTKVYINKIFFEADLRILTGDICFHYYAGYGGGRKSILPAITGSTTIQSNHVHLLNPKAKTGNLEGNPVHLDMEEAAHLANVNYTINVVMNSKGEIFKAFAGDLDQVFSEGVKFIDETYKVTIDTPADIAIVSSGGYPYDIDLYQAYKGIDLTLNAVNEGGVIILAAECSEGYGNKVFYNWTMKHKSLTDFEKEIRRNFISGGHVAYNLFKALEKVKIILISVIPDYYAKGVFRLRTEKTLNSALTSAFRIVGKKGKILVSPNGGTNLLLKKT